MCGFECKIVSFNFLLKSGGKEFKQFNIIKNVNLNKYVNLSFNLLVFIFYYIVFYVLQCVI